MKKIVKIENLVRYESFIIVGIIMIVGTLIKLFHYYDFSSDWFWFIAGLGLITEGTISLFKQRQFNKKYKVIEIGSEEYKKFCTKQSNFLI